MIQTSCSIWQTSRTFGEVQIKACAFRDATPAEPSPTSIPTKQDNLFHILW